MEQCYATRAAGWRALSDPPAREAGWSLHDEVVPPGFLTRRSDPYASGTVLGHTARSQEGAERREAVGGAGLCPAGAHSRSGKRVGGTGLEPVTPSLSSWCSPNGANRPKVPDLQDFMSC